MKRIRQNNWLNLSFLPVSNLLGPSAISCKKSERKSDFLKIGEERKKWNCAKLKIKIEKRM